MGKMTTKIMHSILIMFIILAVSCAGRQIKEESFKSEGAKYNFVFVSDPTVFKETIHQKLIEKYKGQANIDLLGIDKLKDIKANNYNIILIMDTCIAGSPSSKSLNSFISNTDDKRKIVLFVSAGSSYKFSSSGIDAITSASKVEKTDAVYSEISRKIDQIISEK